MSVVTHAVTVLSIRKGICLMEGITAPECHTTLLFSYRKYQKVSLKNTCYFKLADFCVQYYLCPLKDVLGSSFKKRREQFSDRTMFFKIHDVASFVFLRPALLSGLIKPVISSHNFLPSFWRDRALCLGEREGEICGGKRSGTVWGEWKSRAADEEASPVAEVCSCHRFSP